MITLQRGRNKRAPGLSVAPPAAAATTSALVSSGSGWAWSRCMRHVLCVCVCVCVCAIQTALGHFSHATPVGLHVNAKHDASSVNRVSLIQGRKA